MIITMLEKAAELKDDEARYKAYKGLMEEVRKLYQKRIASKFYKVTNPYPAVSHHLERMGVITVAEMALWLYNHQKGKRDTNQLSLEQWTRILAEIKNISTKPEILYFQTPLPAPKGVRASKLPARPKKAKRRPQAGGEANQFLFAFKGHPSILQ